VSASPAGAQSAATPLPVPGSGQAPWRPVIILDPQTMRKLLASPTPRPLHRRHIVVKENGVHPRHPNVSPSPDVFWTIKN
ncbi:MAG: hypothetical protein JO101_06030, partial [Candidatus Eremiobacteraeota bacterium]|nr:hypothetical protein [Candidatus Eremiobacteraeota bacterium]